MIDIMLIEDDEVDIMAVQRMFKKNHVINPCYVAENGLEALAMIDQQSQKSPVSKKNLLILLDFYMPKMNGLEFLAELQFNLGLREIPVIILINFDDIRSQIETSHLNIAGYLSKPIIFSDLTKIVQFDFADSINLVAV